MKTKQKLQKYLEKIAKEDKGKNGVNAFLELFPESELLKRAGEIDGKIASGKAGRLAGMIFGVKANINVLGLHASCASKVLEDYEATYDATVVKKIREEDGLIIGMCNMDEFASGSSGETSAFGATRNPVNKELVPGGSSSGCAAAVAAGFCDVALGSDTGGSIRCPASHCGIVGVKPTYSSVSRYGLIDLSMSLDQIGPLARNVEDCALVLDVIRGKDVCDSISQSGGKIDLKDLDKVPKKLKIGVLDYDVGNAELQKIVDDKISLAEKAYGWEIVKIKIPHLDLAVATYYPLVYVEFFSGTRKFDGRRYGKKIEDVAGMEVLRRILGGAEITKAEHEGRYYNKALKAKGLISKEFEKVFKKVDCVVSLTVPRLPWKIGESISVEEAYASDALTIPYNLYGNCALSVPAGKLDGVPVGMQIACDKFKEDLMFKIARGIEVLE